MPRMTDLSLIERVNYNYCLVGARNRRLASENNIQNKNKSGLNKNYFLLGENADCTSLDFTNNKRVLADSKGKERTQVESESSHHLSYTQAYKNDWLEILKVGLGCSAFFLWVIISCIVIG